MAANAIDFFSQEDLSCPSPCTFRVGPQTRVYYTPYLTTNIRLLYSTFRDSPWIINQFIVLYCAFFVS